MVPALTWKLSNATVTPPGAWAFPLPNSRVTRVGAQRYSVWNAPDILKCVNEAASEDDVKLLRSSAQEQQPLRVPQHGFGEKLAIRKNGDQIAQRSGRVGKAIEAAGVFNAQTLEKM